MSAFSPTAFAITSCTGCTLAISISASTTAILEDGDVGVTFYVKSSRGYGGTVTYSITGPATNGTDYPAQAATGSMSFSGTSTAITTIVRTDDALLKGNETITVTLTGKTGSSLAWGSPLTITTTIVDDETPQISLVATDAVASETGPDTGTFTFASTNPSDSAYAVDFTTTGTATLNTDYTLSTVASTGVITQTSDADFNAGNSGGVTYISFGSVELASDTIANTHITQTSDTDFNAGDITNNVSVNSGSVGLLPASVIYNEPDETNIGAQQLMGIVYRDTTDTNPPDETNLGVAQSIGIGGAVSTDQARPNYIAQLPGGDYRLYYIHHNGTFWELAYRDTTDTNPPDSTNMGAQTPLGVGTSASDQGGMATIEPLAGGGYRLYYTYHNGT